MKLPMRFLMVAAAATLLSLTAACDVGSGTASGGDAGVDAAASVAQGENADGGSDAGGEDGASGGGADNAAVCRDAIQALKKFSESASVTSADNFDSFNSAAQELSTELKTLAGQSDGELKSTLTSMAKAWGDLKVDTSDLAGSASRMLEATQQVSEQNRKLVSACR